MRMVLIALIAGVIGVVAVVVSVQEIQNRQQSSAHVATVAAAKTASKVAKTAVTKASKTAAKTAAKKVKTAQEKLNDELVTSQVKACNRGNILRRTVNRDTLVIQSFMRLAADQYAKVKTPFAQQRAASYRAGADKLRLVPLPNCARVIFKP